VPGGGTSYGLDGQSELTTESRCTFRGTIDRLGGLVLAFRCGLHLKFAVAELSDGSRRNLDADVAMDRGVLDVKAGQAVREAGQHIIFPSFFVTHPGFSKRDSAKAFTAQIVLMGHNGFAPDV
jgi:hypothetical protein